MSVSFGERVWQGNPLYHFLVADSIFKDPFNELSAVR